MTSPKLRLGSFCFVTVVILCALTSAANKSFAASESVLWSFGNNGDGIEAGAESDSGLVEDTAGNLYGTTLSGGANQRGVVFEVSPPLIIGGAWTESVLWSFGSDSDGAGPRSGLVIDKNGNLYGTTLLGGANNNGTVFELLPPAMSGGAWTESILWNFGSSASDGKAPNAALTADGSGNLYGTNAGGGAFGKGTAFELSPSGGDGTWTEAILWSFGNGKDGSSPFRLLFGKSGNLFGTTSSGGTHNTPCQPNPCQFGKPCTCHPGGTAFELSPPATPSGEWKESVLWDFGAGKDGNEPLAGLVADEEGNLYGTTKGGGLYGGLFGIVKGSGTVFKLMPPAKPGKKWTEKVIWNFGKSKQNPPDGILPTGGLSIDAEGNLYGTSAFGGSDNESFGGGGIAFRLEPTIKGKWQETILWNFGKDNVGCCGPDGQTPSATMIMDTAGNLFGPTIGGGTNGEGVIFEIQP